MKKPSIHIKTDFWNTVIPSVWIERYLQLATVMSFTCVINLVIAILTGNIFLGVVNALILLLLLAIFISHNRWQEAIDKNIQEL